MSARIVHDFLAVLDVVDCALSKIFAHPPPPARSIVEENTDSRLDYAPLPSNFPTQQDAVGSQLVGTLPNPWDIAAINLIKVFQQIWDLVFPDILYLVNDKGAVYALAQQKIYDWRSGFAKSAADHIAHFFQLNVPEELKRRRLENTGKGYVTYVAQQIAGNYLFLYGDVKVSWNKPFQSQLVLAILAYHMDATAGVISYIEATPRGALAMSTVAVECAIGMYTTGTYITPREKLAEQIWSRVLNLYKISIETLMPGTWDVIVDSANGLTALDRNLPNLDEAAGPVDGLFEARSMVQLTRN
ncbi:predicted protein [Postia placenta Mad-698-R]|nr:predicted protein [Postia placenta Mad-698-R]